MRASLFLFTLVSCGARDAPPASVSEVDVPAAKVAARVEREPLVVNPLAIVHAERLTHWQRAVAEGSHRTRDLRVVVCGSKPTLEIDALRERLEEHLGQGGARFVPLASRMARELGLVRRLGKWSSKAGVLTSHDPGARLRLELREPFSQVEIVAAQQPRGGSLRIRIDGSYDVHMSTDGARGAAAEVTRNVPEAPHAIELAATGDGPVDLRGIVLDRAAFGASVLEVDCELADGLDKSSMFFSDVDLWILRGRLKKRIESYESALLERGRVWMKKYPAASCLVLAQGSSERAREVEGRVSDALACATVSEEAFASVLSNAKELKNTRMRQRLLGQMLATDLANLREPHPAPGALLDDRGPQ